MTEREVVIGHRLGLHARAAARLVQVSTQFRSQIVVARTEGVSPVEADAKSILSVLLLAAGYGVRLKVSADGPDERTAVDTVCEYLRG